MAGEADEAGMLARAVVVQLAGLMAGADERFGGTGAGRQMGAAFEIGLAPPRFGEHRRGCRDMARLAAVGGAGERQFGIAEAVAVGGAALDQRQGLQRLDRGARKDRAGSMSPIAARVLPAASTTAMAPR